MKTRAKLLAITAIVAALAASTVTVVSTAQTPVSPESKRLADGHPDFSGAWTHRPVVAPRSDPRGICVGFNCGPAGGPSADPGVVPVRAAAAFPNYKPEFKDKV